MSSKKREKWPLVKLLIAYLQGESLEIQGLSALELAVTVDFSGPSALRPCNPVTLCRVLRTDLSPTLLTLDLTEAAHHKCLRHWTDRDFENIPEGAALQIHAA